MVHISVNTKHSICLHFHIFNVRGSVKNNWELSNISKTMKCNLLKFSMIIEQSYLRNPSKESTPQRDVKQCDVIFSDVILRSPFAQWKSEKLKRKVQLLYWEWLSWLKYMIGMCVKLYYLYSLDDWAVGSTDISIFVQEVVLQERLLGNCYNSLENFN